MDKFAPERMFLAVIETGSFAAAAARLGTGSGQASKLVARLEADLGVKLLNRTTRAHWALLQLVRGHCHMYRALQHLRKVSRNPLWVVLTKGIHSAF